MVHLLGRRCARQERLDHRSGSIPARLLTSYQVDQSAFERVAQEDLVARKKRKHTYLHTAPSAQCRRRRPCAPAPSGRLAARRADHLLDSTSASPRLTPCPATLPIRDRPRFRVCLSSRRRELACAPPAPEVEATHAGLSGSGRSGPGAERGGDDAAAAGSNSFAGAWTGCGIGWELARGREWARRVAARLHGCEGGACWTTTSSFAARLGLLLDASRRAAHDGELVDQPSRPPRSPPRRRHGGDLWPWPVRPRVGALAERSSLVLRRAHEALGMPHRVPPPRSARPTPAAERAAPGPGGAELPGAPAAQALLQVRSSSARSSARASPSASAASTGACVAHSIPPSIPASLIASACRPSVKAACSPSCRTSPVISPISP